MTHYNKNSNRTLYRRYVPAMIIVVAALSNDTASADPTAGVIGQDLDRNTVALRLKLDEAKGLLGACFRPSADGKRLEPSSPCFPQTAPQITSKANGSGITATRMTYPGPHVTISSRTVKWTSRTITKTYEYDTTVDLAGVYDTCKQIQADVLYVRWLSVGTGNRVDMDAEYIGERAAIKSAQFQHDISQAKPISLWPNAETVVEMTLASAGPMCADIASAHVKSLILQNHNIQDAFDVYKKQMQDQLDTKNKKIDDQTKILELKGKDVATLEALVVEKDRQLQEKDKQISAATVELDLLKGKPKPLVVGSTGAAVGSP
jgi:hypothetical protein